MIYTNDLIGLKRAWGAFPGDGSNTVDCCALAAEIHYRLGYKDYRPELRVLFRRYSEDTLPASVIPRWLLKNGQRIRAKEPHAVVLLPNEKTGALGTILDDGSAIYIAPSGNVVRGPLPEFFGWYFRLHQ